MAHREPASGSVPGGASRFATTHWSLVLAARDHASPQSRDALAALCAVYWYPLYAYVRRCGRDASQAQDLTQEFFARLLEKDYLQVVDREKGKFRSFLMAALRHFLLNEYDRARAQKRGGGRALLSIDPQAAEGRYCREPAHVETPEKLYERRWALTLLDQVLARLREEMTQAGKERLFEGLKAFLTGEARSASHREVATKLEMTEGAVKVAVHRLRRQYRELLREEIRRTLDESGKIEDEIRELFAALGS
jgi:RNA polymerase sigma-70 factor (ECF subfamily)